MAHTGQNAQAIYDMLTMAVAGDTDGAENKLRHLVEANSNTADMYSVCIGIATGAKKALLSIYGQHGIPVNDGEIFYFKQLGPEKPTPATLFSMRFLIAHTNDDSDTTWALYEAALRATPEEFVDSVVALLIDTVGLLRFALGQLDAR